MKIRKPFHISVSCFSYFKIILSCFLEVLGKMNENEFSSSLKNKQIYNKDCLFPRRNHPDYLNLEHGLIWATEFNPANPARSFWFTAARYEKKTVKFSVKMWMNISCFKRRAQKLTKPILGFFRDMELMLLQHWSTGIHSLNILISNFVPAYSYTPACM